MSRAWRDQRRVSRARPQSNSSAQCSHGVLRTCLLDSALRRLSASLEISALRLGRTVRRALARRCVIAAAPRRKAIAVDRVAWRAGLGSARGRGAVQLARAREHQSQAAERHHVGRRGAANGRCQLSSAISSRSPLLQTTFPTAIMSTAEKMKVDTTRAAETVRARAAAMALAFCVCIEAASHVSALRSSDERQGARGQGRHRGEDALHHGAREGGALPARPRCVAAASAAPRAAAAFLAGPLRASRPPFAPPAHCRHSADAPRGAARPQMAHDAKESIASGLHKVGEKLHIVDPEKKI
jgi:hypothetical protein